MVKNFDVSTFESDEEWTVEISKRSKTWRRNTGMATQGGEVRKLHIIYFISRMGHMEHPHLIRVHHRARNGVYLRDVKRWLGELRGKDMPEAFAWSYKRRYKTGYVWQDLLDDDLITPISDNEYILKGYQFSAIHPFDKTPSPVVENDGSVPVGQNQLEAEHEKQKYKQSSHFRKQLDSKINSQRNVLLDPDQESQLRSERSAMLTDLYEKLKLKEKLPGEEGNEKERESNSESSCRYMCKHSDKNKDDEDKIDSSESSFSSSTLPHAPFAKKHSNEAAHWFRKLLSCRAVDTNDAMVKLNMANTRILNRPDNRQNHMTQILPKRKFRRDCQSL